MLTTCVGVFTLFPFLPFPPLVSIQEFLKAAGMWQVHSVEWLWSSGVRSQKAWNCIKEPAGWMGRPERAEAWLHSQGREGAKSSQIQRLSLPIVDNQITPEAQITYNLDYESWNSTDCYSSTKLFLKYPHQTYLYPTSFIKKKKNLRKLTQPTWNKINKIGIEIFKCGFNKHRSVQLLGLI